MPAGPHDSKNALCGLTTGTNGATMSSTRRLNSANASAIALSDPAAWRRLISRGNKSQRGSMPAQTAFPFLRHAFSNRSAKCMALLLRAAHEVSGGPAQPSAYFVRGSFFS